MKEKIYCNGCGRELKTEQDLLVEDALEIRKDWGFFSKKDLQVHEFVLCEECYDKMIEAFALPVRVSDKMEVLN